MLDLYSIQWSLLRTYVNVSIYIRRSSYFSPSTQPNLTRVYPCRPDLYAARIFLPPNQSNTALPLVMRVHGGGFLLNNPSVDDPIARHIADHALCCVVSIDYSKSPQAKFPVAYEDVIALSLAVIEDPDLPIDRSRVVLCGSSTGGNLVLGAAQDERVREKVVGVAAIYPPVDLVPDGKAKMATRPDPSIPDFLGDSYDAIRKLYFDSAATPAMTDSRASPTYFATRGSLPAKVLLIGVEHDMLCHEDEAMAEKLAAAEVSGGGGKVENAAGWRTPGVSWHKTYGQRHAFEGFPDKDPEKEKERLEKVEEMYGVICEWLEDVFSSRGGQN